MSDNSIGIWIAPDYDADLIGRDTHCGWLIEQNWLHEWEATHPDFDGPEDSRHVSAKTRDGVIKEIEFWIEENAPSLAPLTAQEGRS